MNLKADPEVNINYLRKQDIDQQKDVTENGDHCCDYMAMSG